MKGSGREKNGREVGGVVAAPRLVRTRLKTAPGRTVSQQRWLTRQLNDPYVASAKRDGYRSRAAYKLIELDERFHLIAPRCRVLDLGAAPGGWSQVALQRGAARVVGIDLLPIDPVAGAVFLRGDLADAASESAMQSELGGTADLVLSDMAPNTTGHAETDHLRIVALAELAFAIASDVLTPGGHFVAKVFQGGAERTLLEPLKQRFRLVRHAKPRASRKESSELYVVASGFRPATFQPSLKDTT